MNINWHDPDLYSSLCLLAAITTLVAIIHEFRRRKPGQWKRAKPLDGLLRVRPSLTLLDKLKNRFRRRFTPGEVQRLEQHSRTRLSPAKAAGSLAGALFRLEVPDSLPDAKQNCAA
jgi:hypothetical protein